MAARLPPFRRFLLQSNQRRPAMPSSPSFPHPPPPLSPPPYGVLGRPSRLFLGTDAPDPPRYDGGLLKTTGLFLSASVLFYINGVLVDRTVQRGTARNEHLKNDIEKMDDEIQRLEEAQRDKVHQVEG